jgi:hypothetical protein
LQATLRAAAILLLGGLALLLSERHPWRLDLSPAGSHTPSPQALAALGVLDGPLSLTLFLPDREPEHSRSAALLDALGSGRAGFSWEIVDPGQYPRRALAAGITETGTVIVRAGEREERFVVPLGEQGIYDLTETQMTQALLALGPSGKTGLGIVQGPGIRRLEDPEGYAALGALLEFEGYRLSAWEYLRAQGGAVPDSLELLVLPGPHLRLPEACVAGLESFLARGGALLLMLDPRAEMGDDSNAAGLDSLLARRGLVVGEGFVIDLGEENINLGKGFEIPVVSRYGKHPLTRPLQRATELTCFPLARAVMPIDSVQPHPVPLAFSSPKSFEERGPFDGSAHFDEGEDVPGPLVIAALSDSGAAGGGPLLVIGDSHFATGPHIDWSGNASLVVNAMAWLSRQTHRIAPRPPRDRASLLRIGRGDRRLIGILTLVVLPLATFMIWPLRLLWRRRASRRGSP